MYSDKFSNIDELIQAVVVDKNAEGVRATVQNRYPIRFVLFDNFKDSYAFTIRLVQELHITIEDIQQWIDPDYPDIIISHQKLATEIERCISRLNGESKIIAPFSELARFYDNHDYKEFDTLIRTIKNIQTSATGWGKKQRIYIPIVGLEGKMSTFFGDTQATIWYMRSQDHELSYRLLLTDQTTYGVKNITERYTVLSSVREWLNFWRDQGNHGKANIICTSRAIFANACYAQPDNAFTYCCCDNVHDFVCDGLRLPLGHIPYRHHDKQNWETLAKEIDMSVPFDFERFFSLHFSSSQLEDYRGFVKLWFEYRDEFSRWLLVNTYIHKKGDDYLCHVIKRLEDYSNNEFVGRLALAINDDENEMDIRRYCLEQAKKRGAQLSVELQSRLQKRLEEIAGQDNHHWAIRLFTPISAAEKELAINWLSNGKIQVKDVKRFYPELYYYLQPSIGTTEQSQAWVLDYIDKYKVAKISDTYTDEVEAIISSRNKSAVDFNSWYQKFQTTNNLLYNRGDIEVIYWIDGLGIDWIPLIAYLIQRRKEEKVFLNDVKIARALLPTKTDINKENLLKLGHDDVKFEKAGDIDSMAHQNTRAYPENIIEEIQTLSDIIDEVLRNYIGKKIAIVSDHGMTYLSGRVDGLNLGGFDYHHFGRYAIKQSGTATADDNYFVLDDGKTVCALSHRSLGNKIAKGTGAHGGCTPEEVLVPILIISSSPNNKTWEARLVEVEVSATHPVVQIHITGLSAMDSPLLIYKGNSYKLINKGNNIYESERMPLEENECTLDLHIGDYSEILKITVNTGGHMDDMFGDMGIDL